MHLQGTEKVIHHLTQAPEQPLVSVCVQTYQHVNYIKDCLDGILMQKTNFPIEVLLGEDASIDGTREICIEYADKYPEKIRLFLHDRSNVIYIGDNPTGRYNLLYNLNAARGKYIALCEGDDYWTAPDKLQRQVDEMEKYPEVNISFHAVEKISGKTNDRIGFMGNISRIAKIYEPHDLLNVGLQNMPTCSLIIKSDFIKNPVIEDFMKKHGSSFFLKFLPATPSGALFLNHVMGRYRVFSAGSHGERVMNNVKLALDYYKSVNKAFDKANELTNYKYDKEIQDVKNKRGINVLKRKDLPFISKCRLYSNYFRLLNKHDKIFLLPLFGKLFLIMNNRYQKLKDKRQ